MHTIREGAGSTAVQEEIYVVVTGTACAKIAG